MITYQEYHTKSPLNGSAAKWAEQQAQLFPVDTLDLAPPLDKPQPSQPAAPPETLPAQPKVAASEDGGAPPASGTQPVQPSNHGNANEPPCDPWTGRISIE